MMRALYAWTAKLEIVILLNFIGFFIVYLLFYRLSSFLRLQHKSNLFTFSISFYCRFNSDNMLILAEGWFSQCNHSLTFALERNFKHTSILLSYLLILLSIFFNEIEHSVFEIVSLSNDLTWILILHQQFRCLSKSKFYQEILLDLLRTVINVFSFRS